MSNDLLTSRQAAEFLGITPATLYAYVSRGLLRSEPAPDGARSRRYRRREVESLAARREIRRDPSKVAPQALDHGLPVLDSAITLIRDGRLFYRGHDAVDLARTRLLEDVAELIWHGALPTAPRRPSDLDDAPVMAPARYWAAVAGDAHLEPFERLQILLPLATLDDLGRHGAGRSGAVRAANRLLRSMALAAAGARSPRSTSIADMLVAGWCDERIDPQRASFLLNAALVLCADHELNVSAFAARVVASAGTTPYEAVTAGLAALGGIRHGGLSRRCQAVLTQLRGEAPQRGDIRRALARWAARGEDLPGFGHPIYADGDPRGRALLELLSETFADDSRTAWILEAADVGAELVGGPPTIDFGLAALAVRLDLPSGAALALFALGRAVGWVGQALEQLESDQLIRPRARYVGPEPASDPAP